MLLDRVAHLLVLLAGTLHDFRQSRLQLACMGRHASLWLMDRARAARRALARIWSHAELIHLPVIVKDLAE